MTYSRRVLYPSSAHTLAYMSAKRASKSSRRPRSSPTKTTHVSACWGSDASDAFRASSRAPQKWYALACFVSRAATTDRSFFRSTTSHAPLRSSHSNAWPKLVAPASALASFPSKPGRRRQGGTTNTRCFSDMAQSWMSANSSRSGESAPFRSPAHRGRSTTCVTSPVAEMRATCTPMLGGAARPHVYKEPSESRFACAEKPMGRRRPALSVKTLFVSAEPGDWLSSVSSVRLSTRTGAPPSHSARSSPAWTRGAVLLGLVGKRKRLANGKFRSSACVHAPRTATPLSTPARSCAANRDVRTNLIPARTVTGGLASSLASSNEHANVAPSPSNQCAYLASPTRHRPGPTRNSAPRRSSGIEPVTWSGLRARTGWSPQGSKPPRQGHAETASRAHAGGASAPEVGRGTSMACSPRAVSARGGGAERRRGGVSRVRRSPRARCAAGAPRSDARAPRCAVQVMTTRVRDLTDVGTPRGKTIIDDVAKLHGLISPSAACDATVSITYYSSLSATPQSCPRRFTLARAIPAATARTRRF